MTETEHRTAPDLLDELRTIDGHLDRLFARRAWVVGQLEAGPGAGPQQVHTGTGDSVQRVLLTTGAALLGLAGLFFAAVAWALVGPPGRFAILLVLGAVLGGVAAWARPRLGGAAGAIAAVSASLVATAGYAAPALWEVSWSGTGVAGYTAAVSAALCAAYAGTAVATGIRSWTVAATVAAAIGVLAAGLAAALAADDVLGFTAATAALFGTAAAARPLVRVPAAWWSVFAVAGGTSVLSLLAWTAETDRPVPYAVGSLGWAALTVAVRRLAPAQVAAGVAHTATAMFTAAAASLVVGTLPWGLPNLPLTVAGATMLVAVVYVRRVPALPGTAAAAVLAAGSVLVPAIDAADGSRFGWVAWFVVVALAAAVAGASPRLGPDPGVRGVLWWTAGTAAGAAWLVFLGASLGEGPVERGALPVGVLLLLAGAGWSVSVRRSGTGWLPTAATLLPGLLVALLPGALAALTLTWDAGWSEALARTVVYTAVGGALAVVGARFRVAALLVAGEGLVAVCVLAHLSAATQVVPQWVVLAGVGALLLAVGARWEWLRGRGTAAAGWVGRLR